MNHKVTNFKLKAIIMKSIFQVTTTILMAVSLFFYSCQKEISGNNAIDIGKPHAARVYLTDHQTPVFDSVFIDLRSLEVKLEGDTLHNGGWISLNIRPGIYNILRFRNGIDTLFATGTLPNARVKKIRLTLGTKNSVMKDGQSFPLRIKDEDMQAVAELESSDFEITSSGHVLFWIDFDAGRSVQIDNSGSGNNNGYRLKSSIKIFTSSNSGRIEGKVLPIAADAIVKAIIGSDTTTAIPEDDDGEFKIVGLDAGIYKVFIDGQNGYRDSIINNVIVRNGEDTHLSTVILNR
jgi:hypothetical protein